MNIFLIILSIVLILITYGYIEHKLSSKKKEIETNCLNLAREIHVILKKYMFTYSVVTTRFKKTIFNQKLSLAHKDVKGYVGFDLTIEGNLITIKLGKEVYVISEPYEFSDILDKLKFTKNEQ